MGEQSVERDIRDDLRQAKAIEIGHGKDPSAETTIAEWQALMFGTVEKYDPNQPRDWRGRWTSGGGSLEFSEAKPLEFIMARDASSRINYLSPLKPDDLRNHKLLMNKDHTVGVAISPEGDIQNVFNNGGPKGAGTIAVKSAIMHGGTTLDCYAGFLPGYYSKLGFEEVSRIKFDPQYAPPNWDYANDKMPDIVYMKLRK